MRRKFIRLGITELLTVELEPDRPSCLRRHHRDNVGCADGSGGQRRPKTQQHRPQRGGLPSCRHDASPECLSGSVVPGNRPSAAAIRKLRKRTLIVNPSLGRLSSRRVWPATSATLFRLRERCGATTPPPPGHPRTALAIQAPSPARHPLNGRIDLGQIRHHLAGRAGVSA